MAPKSLLPRENHPDPVLRRFMQQVVDLLNGYIASGLLSPTSSSVSHAALGDLDYASAGHTGFAGTGADNTFTGDNTFSGGSTFSGAAGFGVAADPLVAPLWVSSAGATQQVVIDSTAAGMQGASVLSRHLSASPADGDVVFAWQFFGRTSPGLAGAQYADLSVLASSVSPVGPGGKVVWSVLRLGSLATALSLAPGEAVFNDGGEAIDFRVETDAEPSAFLVDATNELASFAVPVSVAGTVTVTPAADADPAVLAKGRSATQTGKAMRAEDWASATARWYVEHFGRVVVNQNAALADLDKDGASTVLRLQSGGVDRFTVWANGLWQTTQNLDCASIASSPAGLSFGSYARIGFDTALANVYLKSLSDQFFFYQRNAAPAAPAITLLAPSSTAADRARFSIDAAAVDNTDASRKYRFVLSAHDTAAREVLRGEASGTAAKIGFLGAAAAARYSSTGDLRQLLIDFGLLTSGGATPLDLNGGDLTARRAVLTTEIGVGPAPFSLNTPPFVDPASPTVVDDLLTALEALGLIATS